MRLPRGIAVQRHMPYANPMQGTAAIQETSPGANAWAPVASSVPSEVPPKPCAKGDAPSTVHASTASAFDWDAGWNVLSVDSGLGGGQIQMYVHDPGEPIGTALAVTDGAPTTLNYAYFLQDQIGSTRKLFDGSKNETASMQYSPFGQVVQQAGTGSGPGDGFPYKFTGQLDYGDASGHSYFPYRHYDAGIGRWMSRDPLGMVDGPNLYGYVRQSPINRFDPMGAQSQAACIAACTAAYGIMVSSCFRYYRACNTLCLGLIWSPPKYAACRSACAIGLGLCQAAALAVYLFCLSTCEPDEPFCPPPGPIVPKPPGYE